MTLLRATQLFARAVNSSSYVNVYTVPTGHRVILRSINMRNDSGAAVGVQIALLSVTDLLSYPLGAGGTISGNFEWRTWIVLGEGQSIGIATVAGQSVAFVGSGSVHYLP